MNRQRRVRQRRREFGAAVQGNRSCVMVDVRQSSSSAACSESTRTVVFLSGMTRV